MNKGRGPQSYTGWARIGYGVRVHHLVSGYAQCQAVATGNLVRPIGSPPDADRCISCMRKLKAAAKR
jgi:hypothetical protein